jgi:hypothetical protein
MTTISSLRRVRLLGSYLTVLPATGALLTSSSSAAQRSPTTKPTIVLVHGAWADVRSRCATRRRTVGR